jgi:hypothetical protein
MAREARAEVLQSRDPNAIGSPLPVSTRLEGTGPSSVARQPEISE